MQKKTNFLKTEIKTSMEIRIVIPHELCLNCEQAAAADPVVIARRVILAGAQFRADQGTTRMETLREGAQVLPLPPDDVSSIRSYHWMFIPTFSEVWGCGFCFLFLIKQ